MSIQNFRKIHPLGASQIREGWQTDDKRCFSLFTRKRLTRITLGARNSTNRGHNTNTKTLWRTYCRVSKATIKLYTHILIPTCGTKNKDYENCLRWDGQSYELLNTDTPKIGEANTNGRGAVNIRLRSSHLHQVFALWKYVWWPENCLGEGGGVNCSAERG